MLEHYYQERRTLTDFRRGPLGPYFDRFAAYFKRKRYAPGYAKAILGIACQFNVFLIDRGITRTSLLSHELANTFLDLYCGDARTTSLYSPRAYASRALKMLLAYLAEIGVFQPSQPKPKPTRYSWILEPYLRHLRQECALHATTVRNAQNGVSTWLAALGPAARRERFRKLSATQVDASIQQHLKDSPENLSRLGGALRRFFRYCAARKLMARDFATLIPPVRRYRHAALPKGLEDATLERVIRSIDRHTPMGARDYAIILLLMGYGIRGISAAQLRLEDLDWAQSQIRIRAQKGGKEVVLPLLDSVGEALVAYLRFRGADHPHRQVFLASRAPFGPLNSVAISMIAKRHLLRAGVRCAGAGTRSFRHSWAIRALAHDSPIKAIADVLGHRYIDTTFIYAKADLPSLRNVAMPWPERK